MNCHKVITQVGTSDSISERTFLHTLLERLYTSTGMASFVSRMKLKLGSIIALCQSRQEIMSSSLSCDWSVIGRSETVFRESNVTKMMTLSTNLFFICVLLPAQLRFIGQHSNAGDRRYSWLPPLPIFENLNVQFIVHIEFFARGDCYLM